MFAGRRLAWLIGAALCITGIPLSHAATEDVETLVIDNSGSADAETRTPATRSSRSGASTSASDSASSSAGTARLERKLEEISAKQEEILKRFDAVMEELRIIKVRSSIAASRGS